MPPKLKTRRFCPNPGVHCKVVGFWSEFQKRCFLISWNSPFRTPTRRNCFKMRANSLCRTEISKLDRNRRARKYPSNSQRRRARPGGAREQKFSTSASAPRLFSFKKLHFERVLRPLAPWVSWTVKSGYQKASFLKFRPNSDHLTMQPRPQFEFQIPWRNITFFTFFAVFQKKNKSSFLQARGEL